jgi:predicted enzyme related to lactoylglutathione lyase
MRTYKDAKAMAKSLRESLAARSISLSHSECLEIVARQFGFAEWNMLSAKLDVEAGRLVSPETPDISLSAPIPTLRVTSLEEAKPFYADFLGFQFDWGFPEGNTYAQISRSQITLHLNAESRLTGSAGMLIRMKGLDALHRELSARSGPFSPSDISFTPWDSRVFHVIDPFGNAMRFWENNPPGVASAV